MLGSFGELATFVAIAIASGIIGNASWDAVKAAVRRILEQRRKCEGHERFWFTEAEVEQLIAYVVEYDNGFANLPERIQRDLMEEILGDAAAENMAVSKKLMDTLFSKEHAGTAEKHKAVVLYRELARRSNARSRRRPNRSSWRFWSGVGG